jgi:mannose-6-phosphate isomerase-like protein (cupin superfamily)
MKKAFLVQPVGTCGQASLNVFGNKVTVLVAGRDNDSGFSVMEGRTEPMGGPPLHRHNREDEFWYILEGEYRFEVDGEMIYASTGCSVYAARGTAHTFQNIGDKPGRMLVITRPSGLDEFFTELSAATAGMREPDPAVVVPIFDRYGLELLGPPLAVRDQLHAAAHA